MRDIIKSFFEKLAGIRRDQEDLFSVLTEQGDKLKNDMEEVKTDLKELRKEIRSIVGEVSGLKQTAPRASAPVVSNPVHQIQPQPPATVEVADDIQYDSILFGIDIGTTATRISCHTKDSHNVLRIGETASATPYQMPSSVVFLQDRIVTGETALTYAEEQETRHIKLRLVNIASLTEPQKLEVKRVFAELLKELIGRVGRHPGFRGLNPGRMKVNLNTSSLFNIEARILLVEAAKEAGLTGVSLYNIIEEPIAAGLAYADTVKSLPEPLYLLVCDYGGGTFDCSLIKVETDKAKKNISVLASAGVGNCGGVAIDSAFADYLSDNFGLRYFRNDPEKERLFLQQVEMAKIRLSTMKRLDLNISVEAGKSIPCSCDQGELNNVIDETKIIEDSLDAIEWTFRVGLASEAKRQPSHDGEVFGSDFAQKFGRDCNVLFVGGTSRTPHIRSSVLRGLHDRKMGGRFREVESSQLTMDPIEAVVKGDAYKESFEGVSLNRPPHKIVLALKGRSEDVNNCFEQFLFYEKGQNNRRFCGLSVKLHEYDLADPDEFVLKVQDYYGKDHLFKKEEGASFEDILVDAKTLHEGRQGRLTIRRFFNGIIYVSASSHMGSAAHDVGRYVAPWRLDGDLSGFSSWHEPMGPQMPDDVG